MPGSNPQDGNVPDDREAWLLAAAWGSYVHAGDPGACLYGFRAGGSPPQGPGHRDACLAHVNGVLLPGVQRRTADAVASGAASAAQRDELEDLARLRRRLTSWADADLVTRVPTRSAPSDIGG